MSNPVGAQRYRLGGGDAYYDAVKYGGYTGTREQFGRDQAEFAQNATAVAQAKEEVEQNTQTVVNTAQTFTEETVPATIQSVEEKGDTEEDRLEARTTELVEAVNTAGAVQVQAVRDEGTTQIGLVSGAGTAQVEAVEQAGSDQVDAVELAGSTQVGNVNSAGTTQVGNVNSAGTTQVQAVNTAGGNQVQAVEDKGEEVLNSIPSDYTDLTEDVDNLKTAINNVDKFIYNTASEKVYDLEISTSGSSEQLFTYSFQCFEFGKLYFIVVELDDVKLTDNGIKVYGCKGRNSSNIVDTIQQFRSVTTGDTVMTGIYTPSASNVVYLAVGVYQNDTSYTQKATAHVYEIMSDSLFNTNSRIGILEDYKNELIKNSIPASLTFINGTINNSTGAVSDSTKSIVTEFFNGDGYFNFTIKSGYRYKFMMYNLDGTINDPCDGWGSNNTVVGVHSIPVDRNHKYRLQLSTTSSATDFDPADYALAIGDMCFVNALNFKSGDVISETRNFGYSIASFAVIKGKLYVFNYTSTSDPETAVMGNIYYLSPFGIMQKSNKTFTCNTGHMNTVDYCEESDCLIIGNGGSSTSTQPNKIYIFKNASSKADFLISDADCITIDVSASDWGKQLNCVWGENNEGQNNIIYCLTNYESGNMDSYGVNNPNNFTGESKRFIKRVLLGKGTNQLENGTYTAAPAENFNGTYKVLDEWERDFVAIEANNDTCFYNEKIVETIGGTSSDNTIYGLPFITHAVEDFGITLKTTKKSIPLYNADGTPVGYENNGIMMKSGYGYIGKNGYIYTFKV